MRKTIFGLTSALALLVAGCGGSGIFGDMGGPGPDMNLTGQKLQNGQYTVSNVTTVSDGCMIAPLATMFQVTNTGTMLSLGNPYGATSMPVWSPPGYGLGTGTYTSATTATTSNTGITVTLSDGCTSMRSDTTNFTFTGMNAAMVDWKHTEMGYAASCAAADKPPTDPCTSEFTFNIKM
jgi:hypothetical protein